jgi:RNA polymerase sigma-70 factor (ECF subfamily)
MQEKRRARFEAVIDEVGEPLRRYLTRRTDGETAQDVLAEAFLVIWRRLDDVPADAVLPWCYAVARNCLANEQRAARRRLGLVARVARLTPVPELDTTPDLPDAELHLALARLRQQDRDLLLLWAWEDLRPAEIAVVLGITVNAVNIRLHRARGRLGGLLAGHPAERPATLPDRNGSRRGGDHDRRPRASTPPG